jgi:hypothetical protein
MKMEQSVPKPRHTKFRRREITQKKTYKEKYGRAGQATDDNMIHRMRFTCWVTKATNTQSRMLIRALPVVFRSLTG